MNIGGGITCDVQTNDTDYHHPFKLDYRRNEMELMLKMLEDDSSKIPSPSRNDIMNLFHKAWGVVYDQLEIYKREHDDLSI